MLLRDRGKKLKKICIDYLPLLYWKIYILSHTTGPLVLFLNFLAIQTLNNKFCNALLHTTPPIDFSKITIHLCGTRMDRISRAMSFLHNPFLKFLRSWHTQATLIPQYTIIPLFKSHCFLLTSICLQFKQNRLLCLISL